MPHEPINRSLDILGVKPIADAVDTATTGVVKGASAFLSRICLPAAEEFGLLLQDKVRLWRARNAAAVAQKAERILGPDNGPTVQAHPRLVGVVLEEGSWMDVDQVQEMWAGLLASSCSPAGDDDSNLMFADLLARLSVSQARLLNHVCSVATKGLSPGGLLVAEGLCPTLQELQAISGVTDVHRLDREIDHMRSMELLTISSGFSPRSKNQADLTPTTLAIQMYARCKGHRGEPESYFGLSPVAGPAA